MNVNTPTARLTPLFTIPVPAAIHLTVDQLHIQLLQRTTDLRLALNKPLLRGLWLDGYWQCPRPVGERSLVELARLNEIGEKIEHSHL